MTTITLSTSQGLRAACEAMGRPDSWSTARKAWLGDLARDLEWARAADVRERMSREFQYQLWEENHVAALGQGAIPIDRALDDPEFRRWLAEKSVEPLPATTEARLISLTDLFDGLRERLKPHAPRTPRLKIFRVLAVLFPEAMTTVGSAGALHELVRAMGGERGLTPVARHLWVRERLDEILGEAANDAAALAERMSLPWMLYARFVQPETAPVSPEPIEPIVGEARLVPLPAARRRRGLTAIRGGFQGALSILEFVRDGVTRQELLDFLRTSSPGVKDSSLSTIINVLQSELGTVRTDGDKYVLTERGINVLESQDPNDLADWLLTRILGIDRAIVELRERGPLPPTELVAAIRKVNPSLSSDFVPQAIVSWLRSLGVVVTTQDYKHTLTDLGRQWAALIHWEPEALPNLDEPPTTKVVVERPSDVSVEIPGLSTIIDAVATAGHFPPALVARLHVSLWSHARRHFAILTGLSGSGKTLLAGAYAEAITVDPKKQLITLPVQPGWYDPGALLGFTNPLRGDSYVRTAFLEFLLMAAGIRAGRMSRCSTR